MEEDEVGVAVAVGEPVPVTVVVRDEVGVAVAVGETVLVTVEEAVPDLEPLRVPVTELDTLGVMEELGGKTVVYGGMNPV